MVQKANGISVACTSNEVFVRVVGRGTFQNSQPLRRFALDMIQRGSDDFVVDLGQCQSMDSTFLGVLAGIGLRLKQTAGGCVHIVNISDRNLEVVRTLGLDRLFSMDIQAGAHPTTAIPADSAFGPLPEPSAGGPTKPLDKKATANVMLEAHENLVRVDQRNEPRFRDVTQLLRTQTEKPGHKEDKDKPKGNQSKEPAS